MGLSGRKTKQRIPDDPRNLCWADDAARFGSNYLAKFGWDGSTGLGAAGEGRTSYIKVSHKLDLLGIGAAQQKDPDGIAWKQNKDFECLLQRLNDEAAAAESNQTLETGKKEEEVNEKDCVTKKKRKHREDGELKTERKKKRKVYMNIDNEGQSSSNTKSATIQPEKIEVTAVKKAVIVPRHRAHRARAINAKNMSSKSAAHISEILGIAPTTPSHLSERPQQGKLTSLTDELEIEKITTSTKSVADYFKEKINARSSSTLVSASTPRDSDDSYDTPRMGLGSRARLEMLTATSEVERETERMGLSTFPAFSSSSAFEKTLKDEGSATTQMNANLNSQTKDLKKQKKKKMKTKDEEMEKGDSAGEDNDGTQEREEGKRKGKLDNAKKDPQDGLKKQEKRKRKAEKLQVSVTSPQTDSLVDEEKPQKERKERKKESKPR